MSAIRMRVWVNPRGGDCDKFALLAGDCVSAFPHKCGLTNVPIDTKKRKKLGESLTSQKKECTFAQSY